MCKISRHIGAVPSMSGSPLRNTVSVRFPKPSQRLKKKNAHGAGEPNPASHQHALPPPRPFPRFRKGGSKHRVFVPVKTWVQEEASGRCQRTTSTRTLSAMYAKYVAGERV